jgi:hypothetical protein
MAAAREAVPSAAGKNREQYAFASLVDFLRAGSGFDLW